MSKRQTLERIARLERLMLPQDDGDGTIAITLEQLCRASWKADKKAFAKMAKHTSYQLFVYQFQLEDADAAAKACLGSSAREITSGGL